MSAPQPFRCKEAAALLAFYSCGETTEQETALVETHLAACPLCAAQLAPYVIENGNPVVGTGFGRHGVIALLSPIPHRRLQPI